MSLGKKKKKRKNMGLLHRPLKPRQGGHAFLFDRISWMESFYYMYKSTYKIEHVNYTKSLSFFINTILYIPEIDLKA